MAPAAAAAVSCEISTVGFDSWMISTTPTVPASYDAVAAHLQFNAYCLRQIRQLI